MSSGAKRQLVLTSAMAATLSALGGCSSAEDDWNGNQIASTDTAVCVDDAGYRVEDWQCDDDGRSYRGGGAGWFYARRGSTVPYYGDPVVNGSNGIVGSRTPEAGKYYTRAASSANMTRSAAVSRGGFGSSGRGFGGGRS